MNQSLTRLQVPTGVGPSGTPLNSGDYVSYVNNINKLIRTLPDLASKFAFVNEFSGGPNQSDKNRFDDLKKNNFIVKLPARQRGDGSSIL
jgi:hypothetical protein